MPKDPIYAIQATLGQGKVAYVEIDPDIRFVSNKANATLFKSRMLCYGWMFRAKTLFMTYKFSIITL